MDATDDTAVGASAADGSGPVAAADPDAFPAKLAAVRTPPRTCSAASPASTADALASLGGRAAATALSATAQGGRARTVAAAAVLASALAASPATARGKDDTTPEGPPGKAPTAPVVVLVGAGGSGGGPCATGTSDTGGHTAQDAPSVVPEVFTQDHHPVGEVLGDR